MSIARCPSANATSVENFTDESRLACYLWLAITGDPEGNSGVLFMRASSSIFFPAIAAALLLTAAMAVAAPSDHQGGRLGGIFTPEQRAMYMMDARDQMQAMTPDQKKSWRHDQVAKVMALSDGERKRLKAGLQAKWDALPKDRKDSIERNILQREQEHAAMAR
jgi:hypothetical protein